MNLERKAWAPKEIPSKCKCVILELSLYHHYSYESKKVVLKQDYKDLFMNSFFKTD